MANNWNIPTEVEVRVSSRDMECIYCRVPFTEYKLNRKSSATWEHIVNDLELVDESNIALCCFSCNSSKGSKSVLQWLSSKYCQNKEITAYSVAPIVKAAILKEQNQNA